MKVLRSIAYVLVYVLIFYHSGSFISSAVFPWLSADFYPIISYILILFWVSLLTSGQTLNIGKGFYIDRFYLSNFFAVFILTAGLCLAAMAVTLTPYLAEYAASYRNAVQGIFEGNLTLALLTVCVIAPAFEEIMFRGVILGEMDRVMPFHLANVIQALIFGFIHGNIIQGIYTFVIGLCLGLVYRRSGNIYMPIAVHILFNTANALIYHYELTFPFSDIIFTIAALILLAAGIYLTRGGRRRA